MTFTAQYLQIDRNGGKIWEWCVVWETGRFSAVNEAVARETAMEMNAYRSAFP